MSLSFTNSGSCYLFSDHFDSLDPAMLTAFDYNDLFDPADLFFSSDNPNPDPTFDFPKLHKQYPDPNPNPVFFDETLFQNPSYNYSPEYPTGALPEFPTGPPAYSFGASDPPKASAQSVAARQRRRRITEKTRELGKLVPGGQKMNTAEMLQAAYKYIKFMQAQVAILEFVGPVVGEDDHLHDLLASEAIQEKLYSSEKCLVPSKFVEEIGMVNGHMVAPCKNEKREV